MKEGRDDPAVRELKLHAARHVRSAAEAEHRELLPEALLPAKRKKSLKEHLLAIPEVGEDADFERHPNRGRVERTGVDCLNPFSA
jgi:antitoxin FitA